MALGEVIQAGEAEQFRAFAEQIAALQKSRASADGQAKRALHVKQHVGAVGELVVTAPESGRFGVFAEVDRRWPVYARFSNGSGRKQRDGAPDARGFALKLVGAPGKKLIEGLEDEVTQDFLFIDTPALPFRTPDEFMAFAHAAKDGPLPLLPRLIGSLGFGRTFGIFKRALGAPKVKSFATHAFHTAAPLTLGDRAAKLGLFPPSDAPAASASGDDYLAYDLVTRLRGGPLTWYLRAQRFIDETTTPIEDASVEWSGPWVELATLTLPQQDVQSTRGKEIAALVNELSFDPWHASEAHRPLGAVMRARRVAYAPSVIARKALPEPRSVLSP
jgi:hypothetical protein